MNFESGISPTVSVEGNDEIRDVSNSGEINIHNNGSCDLQNSDYHELLEENGSEFPWDLNSQVRKGYGLKKWRRIKRDVSRVRESSVKIVTEELPNPSLNPSKRAQVYAEKDQKSEGSLSSGIPVPLFGDHSLRMGASVDFGENSEDGGSKSSTAASVPMVKHDMGFPHDNKHIMSGNSLAQKGQIKKTKGEQIKPEKKTSDYARSNGVQSEKPVYNGGENGFEFQCGEKNGGYQDISTEDLIADLSKEKIENHGSPLDQDPLVESIYGLQTAQEALEKEVLQLKEIGKDISVDDSISDTQPDITKSSEQFPFGDKQNFSWAVHPQMEEIAKRDAEREIEELFKQRIEAEVEYLTISRTVQKLKATSVIDRITCFEEHMKPILEQKLENCCEEIASSDKALKLQKKVCKYTLYFLMQILSLMVILGVFIFQKSSNYVEFVPT